MLVEGQVAWTRRLLLARAARLRDALGRLPPGDVTVVSERRFDLIVALLGVWWAGRSAILPASKSSLGAPSILLTRDATASHGGLALDLALVDEETEEALDARSRDGEAPGPWSSDRQLVTLVTSGTTGTPEPRVKTAEQLLGEVQALGAALGWGEHDRALATVPLHHLYGLLFGFLLPVSRGAAVVVGARTEPLVFHPEVVADAVREAGATRLVTVPAHLELFFDARVDLSGLTQIVSSAAPLLPERARAFEDRFGIEVLDVLGSTETGGIGTRRAARETRYRPLPGVELEVDDEQRLWVISSFSSEPGTKLATGDRGALDSDGLFAHFGRNDGVVKVGGKRISLQEIERIARECAGVRDVAAWSEKVTGLRGEELRLVVAGDVDISALRAFLAERLDAVFVPRRFRRVEAIPRSDRGKIERAALEALFAGSHGVSPPNEESELTVRPRPEKLTLPFDVTSEVVVPLDSPRFSGHFDDAPVLPAVALLHDFVEPALRDTGEDRPLRALARLKFQKKIGPGARLTIRLRASKEDTVRFEVFDAGELAASGQLELEPTTSDEEERIKADRR